PGLRTLRLPSLRRDEVGALTAQVLGGRVRPVTVTALHAATHGNPGLLHDLLVDGGLADLLGPAGSGRPLGRTQAVLPGSGLARLRQATRDAWQALDLDLADELCRLSTWAGLAAETAPAWATQLLLSGRPAQGLAVLDAADQRLPETVLARALLLALGVRRSAEAVELLATAAKEGGQAATRLLAVRAWLLAVDGQADATADALDGVAPGTDREAYVFTLAARGVIAAATGEPNTAVAHLRRALLCARTCGGGQPWLTPYLTASLIDALVRAERISEATTTAADFHSGKRGCGWRIAVAIADLLAPAARRASAPMEPAR
ncbi:MAG TPA: hypothetical protein VJX10_17985, partial [Pseudonocardiaceae bacterium]|nr:hypothetical protein [Pseudonocardiaceae bacterium]